MDMYVKACLWLPKMETTRSSHTNTSNREIAILVLYRSFPEPKDTEAKM